ncbi:hypothetical protein BRSU_0964 [Brachyspira suanatina]|uniref:Lipoprotein n=1 Tax=Brachyspira suanatina TaxID=381802 RepID=A0A0G4K5X7_9SPIR|nr:hypothetical protein [Brachyspira suanatina]CRF32695.1 hypothetical protein BRSU_0964 [Brachyspira suanatina]
MYKKILLTTLISLLILSCSATITNPNPEEEIDIGDGSFIDPTPRPNPNPGEVIITDQTQISEFIKKHNGVYYSRYEDDSLGIRYVIDGDLIYNGYGTKVEATMKTLVGNKLQIYIEGKKASSGALGYEMNDEMYTFNFGSDGNIYLFANAIFHRENYQKPTSGYETKIGEPISELITYTGNYYYYDYDDKKKYYILIDTTGQVYIDENLKINYSKTELSNNVLIISYTKTGGTSIKEELHFYDKDGNKDYKLIFGNTWINNQLQYETLIKYNLFSPYIGTYKSADNTIILTIETTDAKINTVKYSYTPVMIGNTLIIYQYSSREGNKEHKFVFSDDKTKATYTKPDGTTVELNK